MFGYLKVYKPELKIKDYETYKAYYCTLCKTLKKRYGLISSFALNYEAAFLSLFIASLSEGSPCFQNKRCTANPFKKCTCIQNTKEPFELASDLTVSLTYYKILDDIEDSSFLKGLALRTVLPFVKLKNKKSIKLRKEVNSTVYEYIKNQSGTEKQNISEIDAAAYPSSFFFRELIKLSGIEPTAEILSFCFFLGRWIYLFDAFDDIPKDKKSGNFNVFLNIIYTLSEMRNFLYLE